MRESASELAATASALTYRDYYQFASAPFSPTPDPLVFYHSRQHDEALTALRNAVSRPHGVAVLSGDAGVGKTLLAQALPGRLDRTSFPATLVGTRVTYEALLRDLLCEVGVVSRESLRAGPVSSASRDALTRAVCDFLRSLVALGGHGVLIIDDAHHIAPDVLALLAKLLDQDAPGVDLRLVLVGEPRLLDTLARPELRALAARVVERVAVPVLSRADTEDYVWHRLKMGHHASAVYFTPEALDDIYALSGGLPRDISRLCDRALTLAARERTHELGPDVVRRAGRALELLAETAGQPDTRRAPRWITSVLAVPVAAGAFLAFAPLSDWVSTPLPTLPGAPHVMTPAAAEARPIPLEPEAIPVTIPELRQPRFAAPDDLTLPAPSPPERAPDSPEPVGGEPAIPAARVRF